MYTLQKEDLEIIVNGASFLASGGGGGVESARDVIKNIMSFATTITVVDKDDIPDDENALVICGVGAPNAPELHFQYSPGFALEGLSELTGRSYSLVLPLEVGAMNSMIPLLACAQHHLPFVDGDGAGRSVPELEMSTYGLQRIPVDPTMLVNETNAQFPLHPYDAYAMEKDVRYTISHNPQFNEAGAVGAWSMTGMQLKQAGTIVPGSLRLAKDVGLAMQAANPVQAVQEAIGGFYDKNWLITQGIVVQAASQTVEGFDVGTITVQGENGNPDVTIDFVNESLLALVYRTNAPYFILGPDMICSMEPDGHPITNSEIYTRFCAGQKVAIALIGARARSEIRTPAMFFYYLRLLLEKFGKSLPASHFKCVDEVITTL